MYISEEFLKKHQKKCIQMNLHLLLKIKLHLKTTVINEGKFTVVYIENLQFLKSSVSLQGETF